MEGLGVMATRGKLMNVLENRLSSEDNAYLRLELQGLIEDYRQGLLPLIMPLALLKHHLERHPVPDRLTQGTAPRLGTCHRPRKRVQ